ncbi:hypothetical protein EV175_007364, partial [Coemansia sp. RSA 1933]
MAVRDTAKDVLKRLAAKYNVALVVRVCNEEDNDGVLEMLAAHGIIPHISSSIDQSMVWVERAPHPLSPDDEQVSSDPPSSAASSILKAPSSFGSSDMLLSLGSSAEQETAAAVIPRANILFCQTEEGKQHLVRHLLTLKPPTDPAHSYAGYIDTNRDVASRLAMVLRRPVVL